MSGYEAETKLGQVHFYLSRAKKRRIRRAADEYGMSMSEFVRLCVEYYFDSLESEGLGAAETAKEQDKDI